MNPDYEKSSGDVWEGLHVLLVFVLLVSAAVHVGLMISFSDCEFAPLPAQVKSDRRWTKELPVMQMQKLKEDPLAEMVKTEGRPAAAPDTEKQEDRVERLSGPAESAITPDMPASAVAAQPSADAAPEPAKVDAAEWKPRQEILEITNPTVPDDQAAMPRLVIPKVERVAHASDLTPAYDLLPSAGSAGAIGGAGTPVAALTMAPALIAPAPPVAGPPAGGIGGSGSPGIGGKPPSLTVLSQAEEEQRKKDADEAEAARREGKTVEQKRAEEIAREQAKATRPPPPPPALVQVDEKIVEQEKKAVRELRDEKTLAGKPFEQNVNRSLGYWVDPAQPKFKYFRVRIASRAENPLPIASKDIVFMLDASGSIANDRLKSCRKAVSVALRRLNTGDRFNVIAFRDKFSYAFPETAWKDVTEESLKQADDWMARLTAHGQTDVFRTLRSVLTMPRDPARPIVAFVATDGDATSGMTRSSEIISKFSELNDGLISIYMYGVKNTANAYLMDMLTRCNRGSWSRHEGLRWNAAAGVPELSAKFESPVLSDVSVIFTASSRAETYPKLVTNLTEGEPIEIYGLCPSDQKEIVFSMRGLNGPTVYESMFRMSFRDAQPLDGKLRDDWAKRRLYALVADYTRKPNKNLLRDIHLFAERYHVEIPYEKEMK